MLLTPDGCRRMTAAPSVASGRCDDAPLTPFELVSIACLSCIASPVERTIDHRAGDRLARRGTSSATRSSKPAPPPAPCAPRAPMRTSRAAADQRPRRRQEGPTTATPSVLERGKNGRSRTFSCSKGPASGWSLRAGLSVGLLIPEVSQTWTPAQTWHGVFTPCHRCAGHRASLAILTVGQVGVAFGARTPVGSVVQDLLTGGI